MKFLNVTQSKKAYNLHMLPISLLIFLSVYFLEIQVLVLGMLSLLFVCNITIALFTKYPLLSDVFEKVGANTKLKRKIIFQTMSIHSLIFLGITLMITLFLGSFQPNFLVSSTGIAFGTLIIMFGICFTLLMIKLVFQTTLTSSLSKIGVSKLTINNINSGFIR